MRNVIVIGGSAGGIPTLCNVLAGLPKDIPAAVLAVIHTTEESAHLPDVLDRCGSLKVVSPIHPEPIKSGQVYVAQPNRHLLVKAHCAVSWMGPRENRHRPAVDTLFRSSARMYRSHVIAVVLSGNLNDGSAGALAVKARGGTVVVQDPKEAQWGEMPANVLREVEADYCLPAAKIAGVLTELVGKGHAIKVPRNAVKHCENVLFGSGLEEMNPPGYTCPECDGVLLQIHNGKTHQFRCHVGHTFSLESFSESHADALERALWVALRRLNEQKSIQESLVSSNTDNPRTKKRHQENVAATKHDMKLLHEILARL